MQLAISLALVRLKNGTGSGGNVIPPVPTGMTWGDLTNVTWGDGTFTQWSNSTSYPGLSNWKKALANQAAGTSNARALWIGDSVTFGAGSSGSVTTGDLITNNFTSQWVGLLNAQGQSAQCSNILANGPNGLVTHAINDPRMVKGASWVTNLTDSQTVGGYSLSHNTGTFNANTYTFNNVNTFRIWYPLIGSVTGPGGNLQMSVDGGAVTTQSVSSGSSSDGAPTFIDIPAGASGTHTLSITTNTANLSFVIGVEGFNSTKQIQALNAGLSGATTTTWQLATHPWSPFNFIPGYGQDLTVIALGANDWINSVGVPTFTTQLDNLIQKALSNGKDVALQTPVPTNPSGGIATSVQDQYVAAMFGLAATYGLTVIDVYGHFGSYTQASANSWMVDGVHPNAAGYTVIANVINNVLSLM